MNMAIYTFGMYIQLDIKLIIDVVCVCKWILIHAVFIRDWIFIHTNCVQVRVFLYTGIFSST